MEITALRSPAASAPVHDVREGELCLLCGSRGGNVGASNYPTR